jgi:hypothetical protein
MFIHYEIWLPALITISVRERETRVDISGHRTFSSSDLAMDLSTQSSSWNNRDDSIAGPGKLPSVNPSGKTIPLLLIVLYCNTNQKADRYHLTAPGSSPPFALPAAVSEPFHCVALQSVPRRHLLMGGGIRASARDHIE